MENLSKVIVAGFTEVIHEDGKRSISVILKDVVSKNPIFKAKSTKTGTMWAANGFTIETLRAELPLGTVIEDASWGEEIASEFGGLYTVVL